MNGPFFLFALSLLLLVAINLSAQVIVPEQPKNCSLSFESAPNISGFKLGMKPDEIAKIIGIPITPIPVKSSYFKPDGTPRTSSGGVTLWTNEPIGQASFQYFPKQSESSSPRYSDRVGGFELAFLDNILVEYVLYPDARKFLVSSDNLHSRVFKHFDLPRDLRGNLVNHLRCEGFWISFAQYDDVPRLSVLKPSAIREIRDRAKKSLETNADN
mgnify:CR=1 FL=1